MRLDNLQKAKPSLERAFGHDSTNFQGWLWIAIHVFQRRQSVERSADADKIWWQGLWRVRARRRPSGADFNLVPLIARAPSANTLRESKHAAL